ncbi:MAG: delta-60 repeat domain-containing protein [Actinomycetota bacterium]
MRADPTPTYDDGFAVGVEADGQIVVAGGAGVDGPNERFVVLAFGPHGSPDPTFGGDGRVFTDVTPKADVPFGLAIQDDGRIVVAGGAAQDGPDPRFGLVRYARDGSLDPSFRGDGTVITNVTPHADVAYGVAIDPDGRIVAAGTAGDGGPAPRFGTVRYLANGMLDPTFGGDGTATTNLTSGFDSAWSVALQPDGSVVCSGVADSGGPHASFAVLRYQP